MIFEKVCSLKPAQLIWKDGRPYSLECQDNYFSRAGALEEAAHVFIASLFSISWTETKSYLVIGEIGFGPGRNFLLTLEHFLTHAPKTARLQYFAFESHPLTLEDLTSVLALWPSLTQAGFLIDRYPPLVPGLHQLSFAEGRVTLYLYLAEASHSLASLLLCGDGELENQLRPQSVDVWYLDGFSPANNPQAWSLALCSLIGKLSHPGTMCSTYSAAGQVRRHLESVGFMMKKQPGFALKRDMLQGVFTGHPPSKLQCTPWYRPLYPAYAKNKTVIIIGAGLAGCYIAYELAQRGWRVNLIEQHSQVAAAASSHSQALLFPGIDQSDSPLTSLMQIAYLYSIQQLKIWEAKAKAAKQTGLLYFPPKNLTGTHALAYKVDVASASQIAGIPILEEGWYLPEAGVVNIPKLCQWLISHESISLSAGHAISQISHESGQWRVGKWRAPVLILANGVGMKQFPQCDYLSLQAVRGQITWNKASESSAHLRLPLCGSGHVLPAEEGKHAIGATYDRRRTTARIVAQDDMKNLSILDNMPTQEVCWSKRVTQHWANIRTVTGDYFPCVGQMANAEKFYQEYTALKTDAKRLIPKAAESYPGLFVFSGFGSKGLTTIPLLASALAEEINGGMVYLPRSILQRVSPNRFLFKRVIVGGS